MTRLDRFEARIPPPVVAALVAAAMWLVAAATPGLGWHFPTAAALAIALAIVGAAVAAAGVWSFHRHRTTVHPLHPEKATAIVTTGVYRWSRNPMYLGMALALLGWAAWLAHPLALLGVPAFMAAIQRLQIVPEERALAAKFGTAYAAYCRHVRRWL